MITKSHNTMSSHGNHNCYASTGYKVALNISCSCLPLCMSTFREVAICAFPAEHASVARSKGDSPLLLRTSSTDLKRPFLEAPSAGKTDEISTTLSHSNYFKLLSDGENLIHHKVIKPPHTHPDTHNKEATNSRAHGKIQYKSDLGLVFIL